MKFLGSVRWRIFLIAWILYSIHFATNVVREHYPAFTIAEHGTFFLDEYQGFHSDIFVHSNGHSVVGNQILVSVFAAIPLFIFDPLLDALEQYSKEKLIREGVTNADYRTDKPMRVAFFRLVKERGLDLRFGAATVITTVFFMAPISAVFLVVFYGLLTRRGMSTRDASQLTFLLGFASPLFYRATVLGHNLFVMCGMFFAFVLLWRWQANAEPLPLGIRLAAGFCGGITLATDYMGVIILPLLYGYMLLTRIAEVPWEKAFRESLALVVGSIPPILFLLYSQWSIYGNAFLPGQFWMPKQNDYTELGMRGFDWPAADLFLMNLFHPGYGLYTWGPLLLLGLVPAVWYKTSNLILPRRERRFIAISFLVLLIFSSANQYARLQWNSGFRYLLPLVPFIFLGISDLWVRMPQWARVAVAIPVLVHSWVIAVFREFSIQASWKLFFQEGIQLPWFRILRSTAQPEASLLHSQVVPIAILTLAFILVFVIWKVGAKYEAQGVRA